MILYNKFKFTRIYIYIKNGFLSAFLRRYLTKFRSNLHVTILQYSQHLKTRYFIYHARLNILKFARENQDRFKRFKI